MMKQRRWRKQSSKSDPLGSDDETLFKGMEQPDPNSADYYYDEVDEFHSQKDKILLETQVKRHSQDSEEEEVLGFNVSDDDYDDNEFPNRFAVDLEKEEMASDLEKDEDDDNIPDPKTWGKNRSIYYSADYVDQDFGGFEGSDAEAAEEEEKEALALQKQLIAQLEDDDFGLEFFKQPAKQAKNEKLLLEEKIERDFSKLSKREKLELLQKESPEFTVLVQDFQEKMTEIKERLLPVSNLIKSGKLPINPATEFVSLKTEVILNYCVNISFYLILKSQQIPVENHPVLKRLTNFRKMLLQMTEIDEHLRPEIDELLRQLKVGEIGLHSGFNKKMKLQRFTALEINDSQDKLLQDKNKSDEMKFKRHKLVARKNSLSEASDLESDDASIELEENAPENEEQLDNQLLDGKRSINYQISKNKGLTPHRKKEQRNPRVKHRMKFRKAKIRRKGQIREARKELQRYGGEISGIKIGISKSVKLS